MKRGGMTLTHTIPPNEDLDSHGEPLMTAAAVAAGIVPPRLAWHSLLWIVPFTLLWLLLIYWQPGIWASGVQTTAHQLMAHGAIAVGLWLGLEGTDLAPRQRRATWLAIMVPYTLWFAIAWSAAINGVFLTGASPLPFLPLAIFLPVIIAAGELKREERVKKIILVSFALSFAPAALAQTTTPITVDNFTRAESDLYFGNAIKEAGGIGRFFHNRLPAQIDRQVVVRMNRDTLYLSAVFDGGPGEFEVPNWNTQQQKEIRDALLVLTKYLD